MRLRVMVFVALGVLLSALTAPVHAQMVDVTKCYSDLFRDYDRSVTFSRFQLALLVQYVRDHRASFSGSSAFNVPGIGTLSSQQADELLDHMQYERHLDVDYFQHADVMHEGLSPAAYDLIKTCLQTITRTEAGFYAIPESVNANVVILHFWFVPFPLNTTTHLTVIHSSVVNASVMPGSFKQGVPDGALFPPKDALIQYPGKDIQLRRTSKTDPIIIHIDTKERAGFRDITILPFAQEPVMQLSWLPYTETKTMSYTEQNFDGTAVVTGNRVFNNQAELRYSWRVDGPLVGVSCTFPQNFGYAHFLDCGREGNDRNVAFCRGGTNDTAHIIAVRIDAQYLKHQTVCTANCGPSSSSPTVTAGDPDQYREAHMEGPDYPGGYECHYRVDRSH